MHWWPSFQRRRIEICRRIVFLKCVHLARIGKLVILRSAKNLVCAVWKWRKSCDSYIQHTRENRQNCHVGNTTTMQTRIVFRLRTLLEIFKDPKSRSRGVLLLLLLEPWLVPLPLSCGRHCDNNPRTLRKLRNLVLWSTVCLSQVTSPTSSTTSTTQEPPKISSKRHPATRDLHTCMTRSTMRKPSAEHVKIIWNVLMRWKNLSDFKDLNSTHFWWKIDRRPRYHPWTHRRRFRSCRMKLIVWMIREIVKMQNQYAAHNPTLPVNLCLSHLIHFLVVCKAFSGNAEPQRWAAKYLGHGTHMVSRETFLQIQRRLQQQLIRKSPIFGSLMYQNAHHHMWRVKGKHQTQLWIRDASQDCEPEIHSTLVREILQRLWSRPTTTADFDLHFDKIPCTTDVCLLEDEVHNKGMYLFAISWCQNLKYSMRGLLQQRTKSSMILTSKEESVWRNKKPKKRTVSFEEDRLPTWSTSTSGSLELTIPSRIKRTYLQLFFEMLIFSILSGTEF